MTRPNKILKSLLLAGIFFWNQLLFAVNLRSYSYQNQPDNDSLTVKIIKLVLLFGLILAALFLVPHFRKKMRKDSQDLARKGMLFRSGKGKFKIIRKNKK